MRTVALLAFAGTVAVAPACAPASFDGLTGGDAPATTERAETRTHAPDPKLAAPRPLSPLSVSFVSTARPRLSWALATGTTGAVVELCRTRACDGDIARVEVEGDAITWNTDLAPGMWFWRLFGRTGNKVGTVPSATWQMLVRGPAKHGQSDAPTGAIFDFDGDGEPDFVASGDGDRGPVLAVWFGDRGKLRDHPELVMVSEGATVSGEPVAAGVDLDGDGFADIVQGTHFDGAPAASLLVDYGGSDVLESGRSASALVAADARAPVVREAGDVNGDGYGDLLVGSPTMALVSYGSSKGPGVSLPFLAETAPLGGRALIGAFDANADGLSDVAYARTSPASALEASPGHRERLDAPASLVASGPGSVERTAAFTTGDFNGDGLPDLAATVVSARIPSVCFWYGDRNRFFVQGSCLPAENGDDAFGSALAAGDVDGDGRDEILVSTSTRGPLSVDIVRIDGDTFTFDGVVLAGIGKRLTTISPGRPGKARWAASTVDDKAVVVFEGTSLVQTLEPPREIKSGFGRAIR